MTAPVPIVPPDSFLDEMCAEAIARNGSWVHLGTIGTDAAKILFEYATIRVPGGLLLTAHVEGAPGFDGTVANIRKWFGEKE